MKRGKTYDWIPLHVDKWLWGSTRHELGHPERAIFIDLLALASKDDGYVRANESTPYPLAQLAGMFNAPVDLMKSTLEKCIQFNKAQIDEAGIIYILNWENYSLSNRQKRRMSAETDGAGVQTDTFSVSLIGSFPNLSSLKKEALLWWNKLAEETGLARIHDIKTESARERNLKARAREAGFSLRDLAEKIKLQHFLLGENDRAGAATSIGC